MAYELQKLTPTHMLHAGRYSALGRTSAAAAGSAAAGIARARQRVARLAARHLPEPARLSVARVGAAVRRLRAAGFRTYWSTRGWYTTIGGAARSALSGSWRRRPRRCARPSSARSTPTPTSATMNLPHQARYRRWAYGFGPYVFSQEIYKDTAIYYSDPETGEPRGSRGAWRRRGRGSAAAARAIDERVAAGDLLQRRHRSAGRNRAGRMAQPRRQSRASRT